ncbi:MAG: hypothetical protein QM740_18065 [Acidovorax sp.]
MAKATGIAMDKDWQAESDMRTLAEAEEIRKDPKRLKAALAKAKEKIAELQKLQPVVKK